MKTGSLRVRLLGLAAVTIALALGLAWLALTILFERHVKTRVDAELASQIVWIAANMNTDAGEVSLGAEPLDPRFQRPFGGLYWQIEPESGSPLRSRSLWDETLPRPKRDPTGPVSYQATGPQERRLFIRAETLSLPSSEGEQTARVLVAADYGEIEGPVAAFGRELAIALTIIGLCLAAAAALQVGVGLAPLGALRKEIVAIRAGRRLRLDPDVPSEVRPLVEEVNELLTAQDDALARARAQAGDLAHGLKTPLTVLSTIARSLVRSGNSEDATEILAQVEMMGRRIDRQLARAKLGTDRLATSRVGTLVERLVSLIRRTPQGERIEWDLAVDPDVMVSVDQVDLAEGVGNVLDNACKWARTRVRITTEQKAQSVALCVEDDGPGVPEDQLHEIITRGTRLDGQIDGSGLGLAIVHDIVSAYRAKLDLSRSRLGGLCVRIDWPRAPRLGG